MVLWKVKGGLTTLWKDKKVREYIWEIGQFMSISHMVSAGPK